MSHSTRTQKIVSSPIHVFSVHCPQYYPVWGGVGGGEELGSQVRELHTVDSTNIEHQQVMRGDGVQCKGRLLACLLACLIITD